MPFNQNSIPYSGYGNVGYQVFTPTNTIRTSFGIELPTRYIGAVFVSASVEYRLVYRDGTTSDVATMPEGMTGVSPNIRGMIFLDEIVLQYFARLPESQSAITFTRRFTELAGSGQQHYTIPTATAAGDYEITKEVYYDGSGLLIVGNTANFNSRVNVPSGTGRVRWRPEASSTEVQTAENVVPINQLSTITVRRTGSTGVIIVNGSQVFSGTVPTGAPQINTIGRNSTSYSSGIIANVNFVSGFTQTGNPAGNPTYLLDESWVDSNAVVNSNSVLGDPIGHNILSDMFINLGETTLSSAQGVRTTDWVPVTGDRQYLIEAVGGSATRSRWQWTSDGGTTVTYGGANFSSSGGDNSVGSLASTLLTTPAGATHVRVYFANVGDTATDLIVREAPGYGQAVNITDTDSEQFTSNQTTSPIQWENADSSTILPVAGT